MKPSCGSYWRAISLLLVLVAGGVVAAEATDNVFDSVSIEIVTPHWNWGKPSPDGTLSVLVIAPAWGQRETVELMQRFDIEAETLMTMTAALLAKLQYGPIKPMAPDKVARRFDEHLARPWDVIVIGGVLWNELLVEHRYRILKQVHDEGTGLVYVAPPNDPELNALFGKNVTPAPEIWAGVPWESLTAFAGRDPEDLIQAGRFGQGRWVALRYRTNSWNQSLTPRAPIPCWNGWEYEYYMSLVGRAIDYAAGRERSASVAIDGMQVTVEGAPGAGKLLVAWHNRGENAVLGRQEVAVAGDGSVELSAPAVPAGDYILTAWLVADGKKRLAWDSAAIELQRDAEISELLIDRDSYRAGDPIRGAVDGTGGPFTVQLWEGDSRLLAEKQLPAAAAFEFTAPQPLTTTLWRIVASAGEGPAARRVVEFPVAGRERPAFHQSIWAENECDWTSRLWYERFRELGVNGIFYRTDRTLTEAASRFIATAGLWGAPMYAVFSPEVEEGPHGQVHIGGLFDEAARAEQAERSRGIARAWAPYDVLHYGDGSDKHMHGNDYSEPALAAFRSWLREQYADLDALNADWRTGFAEWPAVVPDTLESAKRRQHFVSWVQFTQFMERHYAANYARMGDVLREVDAQALLGPDGYGRLNSRDGSDWWLLLGAVGFYNLYTYQDPPQLEITRSLARHFPNVKLRSIYYGSYTQHYGNETVMRLLPWYALLHDYNGLFWWVANGKTTYPSAAGVMAGPDFRATQSYLWSKEGIDEIRAGLIDWVATAERRHNGVAIYYDQLAVHAATAYTHPSYLTGSCQAYQEIVSDLGLQYDYVAAPQIRDGLLDSGGYQILLLPHTLAMDDATAAVVSAWVRDGGTLISNTEPPLYDAGLRPVDGGQLAAILADAGQGRAVVIEQSYADYSPKRYQQDGAAARAVFGELLAGLPRPVTVRAAGNEEPGHPELELVVYEKAGTRLVGLLYEGEDPVEVDVDLGGGNWVCDVRAHEDLGRRDRVAASLRSGDAALFAMRATAIPAPVFGDDLTVRLPDTAGLAVRCEVRQPDGVPRPEYSRVLVLDGAGPARFIIPFALNDPTGDWTITATEVFSGKATTTKLAR